MLRGWNHETTGRKKPARRQSKNDKRRRRWEIELQSSTRRAMVRPMTEEGPILKGSKAASLLMASIGEKTEIVSG